jgi:siderophore synthetase component
MHHPSLLLSRKSEQRVKRQLVEAILFEKLLTHEEQTHQDDRDSSFVLFGKNHTYRCIGRRRSFDRIRLKEGSILRQLPDDTWTEAAIEEILEELVSSDAHKERLRNELLQTIKLCEWNEAHLMQPLSRRESSYEELESELVEGHPYHPCFKSRTGFTLEDHEEYGPEAKHSFALKWTAVRRDKVQLSVMGKEQDFWKRELGHPLWAALLRQLEAMGGTFEEYTFLPIHPWQWKSIYSGLADYIQTKDILPLDAGGDYYRATQSVRTLWNETNPAKAHIKLSMNMVNTSSLRTLDSHTVCAAPYLSNWIKAVVQSDVYLRKEASLVVLQEYAGMMVEPSEEHLELDGQLGAVWRESVHSYIEEDEEAVPFTALLMMENDGRPFIDDWLKRYGTEKWVQRLIEASVIPVWHLLAAHGLAVEAHAQNMILLHKNGWPTRVALRDFHDGIEYMEEFLTDSSLVPRFEAIHKRYKDAPADRYYWMSSKEALREMIMDTLFVFNLSELAYLLDEQYSYEEGVFWVEVETALSRHFERFSHLMDRHKELQHTSAYIYVESLLTKKLQAKGGESFRHLVPNAFSNMR